MEWGGEGRLGEVRLVLAAKLASRQASRQGIRDKLKRSK
jgi:hypothetical protein